MFMLFRIMTAITEGFIQRFFTTTKSNTIPNTINLIIRRFNRNTTSNPKWTTNACKRIFDSSD